MPLLPQALTPMLASVAVLASSAVLLGVFGCASRTYRGYWWWVAAPALLAWGVAMQQFGHEGPFRPLAVLLCMQWPVTVLAGLRRYYGRPEWRAPTFVDALMLGGCFGAGLVGWLADADLTTQILITAFGTTLLGVYAGWLVSGLDEFRNSSPLKLLASTACLTSLYGLWLAAATQRPDILADQPLQLAGGLLNVVIAMALLYLGLLLTGERTEANLLVMQRNLRVLADMDVLTGMANRRHFLERASALLEAPGAPPSTLLMFDIDYFKHINDLLGHAVGDEALRQIARCVRDTLRERDVAGRLGGDEFAVLLPDTSVADAVAVASRIVSALEHRQVAPRVARLALSFGVVQARAGESVADALRRADQALYEAKRQGRSRAVTATGDIDQPVFGESRPMGLAATSAS